MDERLDEAYIKIVLGRSAIYKPLTKLTITVTSDNIDTPKYFVVSADFVTENPNGSGY